MGLNTNTSSRVFLSISDGKIAQRFNEQVPESVQCWNKDQSKTWFEKRYASVSGYIQDIQRRETDFGVRLLILIKDGGELFQLEMPWSSRYSSGFFLSLPNIDLTKEVTFSPWMKVIDGNKKTNLYINQGSESVEWFWTKDDPKDLPPMVKMVVKGQDVWDDTERQNYFLRYINEKVLPLLKAIPKDEPKATEPIMADSDSPIDDLPF